MGRSRRAVCLITVAVSGLGPMVVGAAASASSGGLTAHGTKGCITVAATIPVGLEPIFDAVDPKTNTIYVTNDAADTVLVIRGETNTVTATIPVGSVPDGVAVDPKTNTDYVPNGDANTRKVIHGRRNTIQPSSRTRYACTVATWS